MVTQKFVSRKWNRCVACLLLLYFIFVYQLVRYFLCLSGFYFIFVSQLVRYFSLPVVVCCVEVAVVGVSVQRKREEHV